MKYRNLIWDFDGTLFDSYPHIHASYMQALADFGRSADSGTLMACLKISFTEAHRYVQPTEEIRARFSQYEHDMDFQPQAVLYDGIKALLADTHAAGIRHFLFTHRDHLALRYMERADILRYFTDWITSDETEHFALKPKPDSILYLLTRHGIDKGGCAMIGDREIDIGSGVAADIDGILFDEFRSLGESAARYRVHNVPELRRLLLL